MSSDSCTQEIGNCVAAGLSPQRLARNNRLMQMAAHALWADEQLKDTEIRLFEELSCSFVCDVKLNDKEQLDGVDEICARVECQEERCQIMEIVCSMLTIDSELADSEKQFLTDLYAKLGFDPAKCEQLIAYTHEQVEQNKRWHALMV